MDGLNRFQGKQWGGGVRVKVKNFACLIDSIASVDLGQYVKFHLWFLKGYRG
jgi:hypothetical protein